MNDAVIALCKAQEVIYAPSRIAHSHESNAFVERVNKEVLRHIRNFCQDRGIQHDWTRAIPAVQFIINTTQNTITGYTPHELLFGPASNLQQFLLDSPPIPLDKPAQWWEEQQRIHEQILLQAVTLQKELDDEHKRIRKSDDITSYEIGSYVLVEYPNTMGGKGRAPSKLRTVLRGPMKVLEKEGDKYTLLDIITRKAEELHVTRLHPFYFDPARTDPEKIAYLDRGEHTVDKIIDAQMDENEPKDSWSFLVRWEGYSEEDDLWLSWKELKDVKALHEYLREKGKAHLLPKSHQRLEDRKKLPNKVTFTPEVYHQVSPTQLPIRRQRTKK